MSKGKIYKLTGIVLVMCILLCGCKKEPLPPAMPMASGAITMQMHIPETLNPLKVENQSVSDVLSLCYEPLFAINDSMTPEGVLATDIAISEDCLSAVVNLKASVFWHDGVEFTSADVVRTIELLKENVNSTYYGCVENIDTVQAMGPLSFVMTFTRPYGQIAYSLYFPIVAAHNDNLEETILGTGPYMLDSYSEAVSLSLKKNDNWHGGELLCESVNVSVVRDNEIATTAFNSGNINTITDSSYDSENSALKNNAQTTPYPSTKYEFMAFNHNSEVFDSPAVRSAISLAIDREKIVSEAYAEAACATNTLMHPVVQKMIVDSGGNQYSLSSAGEILFLEGYTLNENTGMLEDENGENFSFSLLVNKENQNRVKTAELLCSQLFLAGIDVSVREVDFQTYISEIEEGTFDAYLGGIDFVNLYDFEFLFSEEGSLNFFGYKSEYMDAALLAIANASNPDILSTALVSFDEVFLREQPVCGLVFRNNILMTAENVTGELKPYPGSPYRNIHNWAVN